VGAPGQEYRALSLGRLKATPAGWEVDLTLFRDTGPPEWHGAAVVAVKDGRVIGLLLAPDRYKALVVPLDRKTDHPPQLEGAAMRLRP
jgi:hypothetical protein